MIERNVIAPPVDEDEETEEETGTQVKPQPVDPGKVDASEGQNPIDEWVNDHRNGRR